MNIYRHKFVCHCPNNSQSIVYELTIESLKMIQVELITDAAAKFKSAFHENLADELYGIFGGRQTIEAHHHGVDVKTVRP